MIKDKLVNAELYYAISDRLVVGFEWLKNTDLENIEDGKYEILGDDVFANVQTYETKEDAPFEAHRNYIDIQYMVNGTENIGVTEYSNCSIKEEYDSQRDLEFLICDKDNSLQILNEGEFLVFFPTDAHQPALCINNKKQQVKKIIVKVLV